MQTTLAALAVVVVGYVLTYFLFDRLRTRFGYVGGAEYVLLGMLLGPQAAGFLSEDVVRDLTPIVSLALGWVGMTVGTYFRFPTMVLLPAAHVRIAFSEAFGTFVTSLALLLPVFHYVVGHPWAVAAIPAGTLAAIATLCGPAAIDALALRGLGTRRLFPVLQLTARIDALVGVVAFGLLLAVFHQGETAPTVRPLTATEWAVINVAVGVASGVLFHLFLGPRGELAGDDQQSRLFVALAGAIVIASGAAYYLNLSPIYTNLILGVILANTAGGERNATRVLRGTERPVYLALLIFAGAAWAPEDLSLLFLAPLYVAIRLAARLAGGWLAGRMVAPEELSDARLGRALLSQGPIGVAVALNYSQVFPGLHSDILLTATLLSVLLFEAVANAEVTAVLDAPAGERAVDSANGAPA